MSPEVKKATAFFKLTGCCNLLRYLLLRYVRMKKNVQNFFQSLCCTGIVPLWNDLSQNIVSNNSVGLPAPRVIPDRKNFAQPGVILDIKLKLQVLCFCITYVIVDYYFKDQIIVWSF